MDIQSATTNQDYIYDLSVSYLTQQGLTAPKAVPEEVDLDSVRSFEPDNKEKPSLEKKMDYIWRNRIGFWILGLCNNFGYVVMLSAAFDILSRDKEKISSRSDSQFTCNPESTGLILIADIIPALIMKSISPLLTIKSDIRVICIVALNVLGLVIVSLSSVTWSAILGVICSSLASGLGEATFLIHSAIFQDPNTISFWSSGTGAAGVFGSISYAGLLDMGMTPGTSLQLMEVIPVLMAVTFWIILKPPKMNEASVTNLVDPSHVNSLQGSYQTIVTPTETTLTLKDKFLLFKNLVRFIIPLGLVYYFEYLINQGLFELIYFPWPESSRAYRWYLVDYQIGVFISRSSVNIVKIQHLWLLPALQFINVILVLGHVLTRFLPHVYFIMAIILWEGLLGGAAYVNTFDQIYNKYGDRERGFCLGAASISDSLGITLSGFSSIFLHNFLCELIQKKFPEQN